jgi:hypothetical protein
MPINRAGGRTSSASDDEDGPDAASNDGPVGKNDLGPSTVTLSGLLNAIDGVSSQVSQAVYRLGPNLADARVGRLGLVCLHQLSR